MAKKQKRSVSRSTTEPVITRGDTPVSRTAPSTEFNPDYQPVIKDLKQIGILAAIFVTILVVLSFFLR